MGFGDCRLSGRAMEYAASFFEGRGSKWNYDAMKNFDTISKPVQHHLQRVRVLVFSRIMCLSWLSCSGIDILRVVF